MWSFGAPLCRPKRPSSALSLMSMNGVSLAGVTDGSTTPLGATGLSAASKATAGDVGRGGEVDDVDLAVERRVALQALAVAAVARQHQERRVRQRHDLALRGDLGLALGILEHRQRHDIFVRQLEMGEVGGVIDQRPGVLAGRAGIAAILPRRRLQHGDQELAVRRHRHAFEALVVLAAGVGILGIGVGSAGAGIVRGEVRRSLAHRHAAPPAAGSPTSDGRRRRSGRCSGHIRR